MKRRAARRPQQPQQYQQPQQCQQPPQYQQPVPRKKNGCLIAVLAALGVLVFFVFLISIGSNDENAAVTTGTSRSSGTDGVITDVMTNGAIKAKKVTNDSGELGDYNITVKESKVIKNGEKNILVVTYSFANNSKDSRSFTYAVSDKLFQNGVELDTVYTSLGIKNEYDPDNKSKEIKPGVTLDVQCAYELNDTATDVEVEISEWLSFNDNKLVYTIKIK